jgi:hypothetical protein
VHRGALSDVSALINESLADAAIARMMLHRRRATIPKVINEFFGAAGNAFTSDLTDPAPQAAADFSSEIAAAKAAGLVAEGACGDAPPLLFERAMLADIEGRRGDALADLRRLLDSYPGFVAAAFAAARVALEDNDPMGAIESLAYVERELFQTREGAALLADALRAVGMHEAASRYDLAALTNAGQVDSRGNDCAPVDVVGNIACNCRMLPAFYVETLPGGRILYNDRGVYYLSGSGIGGLLSAMFNSTLHTAVRALRSSLGANFMWAAFARFKPLLAVQASRGVGRLCAGADRALRRALPHLAAWGLLQTPEHGRHSRLVQAQLRSGIASIFGFSIAALDPTFDRSHTAQPAKPKAALEESLRSTSTEDANLVPLNVCAALPPRAQEVLHRLASMAGIALR